MDPVRMGLIGFGGRGSNVARALEEATNVEFHAVCELLEERRQEAERQYAVETYGEVEEFLSDDTIEAVAVITRASHHASLSVRSMKAGKDVLCTKPLATSVAEANEMVATARHTGRKGAVEFQNRFRPEYWTMKGVASELDPLQVLLTNQRGVFLDRYLKPGYAYGLMDSVAHRIDLANWLAGHTPIAVSGTVRYETFTNAEAIDAANIRIEYTGGRTASVVASMAGSGLDEVCQIVGKAGNAQVTDDGTVEIRDVTFSEEFGDQKQRQRVSSPRTERRTPPADDQSTALAEAFAAYVRGDDEVGIATFEDGLNALLVAKAAVESDEKSKKIHLADLREEISTVRY